MSILIIAEANNGKLKKNGLEAIYYGATIAQQLNTTASALVIGSADAAEFANTGLSTIYSVTNSIFANVDAQLYTKLVAEAATKAGASLVIFSHDAMGKAVAPRFSVRWSAGYASAATDFPTIDGNTLTVKRNVFAGKAQASVKIMSDNKIISLLPNSIPFIKASFATTPSIENFEANVGSSNLVEVKQIKEEKSGEIPLPQAELVVSAGRGMKGPENWGMVEDLANVLHAATACSRPVADLHWRPHHEHVGQTGIAIRPNLYIAIGISGAIQHLAGVNGSKTIVVINKDPEAPFFKAADYGIVGDAFEVLPQLTAALKDFYASKH